MNNISTLKAFKPNIILKSALICLLFLFSFNSNLYAQCTPCPPTSLSTNLTISHFDGTWTIIQNINYSICNGEIVINSVTISSNNPAGIVINGLTFQLFLPALFAANPTINLIKVPASCFSATLVNGTQIGCDGWPMKEWALTWCAPGCCVFDRSALDPSGGGVTLEGLDPGANNCSPGCFPVCYQ